MPLRYIQLQAIVTEFIQQNLAGRTDPAIEARYVVAIEMRQECRTYVQNHFDIEHPHQEDVDELIISDDDFRQILRRILDTLEDRPDYDIRLHGDAFEGFYNRINAEVRHA